MMDSSVLQKCALFQGIAAEEIPGVLDCLGAVRREYQKDGVIFAAGQRARGVGIVLAGGAHIVQEDFWGNRTILAFAAPGELFGEAFACARTEYLPVSVTAAEKTGILLVDYQKIITDCGGECGYHSRLLENMLHILARKNIMLTAKIEHLAQPTIRQKLLSYLSAEATRQGGPQVEIPFSRQELADYLAVDRSALSRELGRMKEQGLLDYHRSRFILKGKDGDREWN